MTGPRIIACSLAIAAVLTLSACFAGSGEAQGLSHADELTKGALREEEQGTREAGEELRARGERDLATHEASLMAQQDATREAETFP